MLRKSGWKVPPTDDARLTLVEGVLADKYLRYVGMISEVDYKCNNSQGFMSIDESPLKVMLSRGEEGWGGGSLI